MDSDIDLKIEPGCSHADMACCFAPALSTERLSIGPLEIPMWLLTNHICLLSACYDTWITSLANHKAVRLISDSDWPHTHPEFR
jgi:hypothetical protein